MAAIRYLEPWSAVGGDEAAALQAELRRELAPAHPLRERPTLPIARRKDCDDVLFLLEDSGEVAVVHLTWRGGTEPDPGCPETRIEASLEAFATGPMRRDHGSLADG